MIGSTISHYRIVGQLGAGGMGVVYKAEDVRLKRPVALKFLPPDLTRDKEAIERFIYEAQTASALDHQNICTIHEIDECDEGRVFICMAFYEGQTLKQKLDEGVLQIKEALDIVIQIARGLAKVHEKGIIHRDIKPGNIIVQTDGTVKIIDFGLSKLLNEQNITKSGTTLGTVAYMAPEQVYGKGVSHLADIWALGVLLYEMLTGERPFAGDIDQAVVYSIMNKQPEPLSSLLTGLPAELEKTVARCLEKEPAKRYQQLTELLEELQSIGKSVAGQGAYVREDVKVGRNAGKIRQTWWRRMVLMGVGFVILMGGWTVVSRFLPGRPRAPETHLTTKPLTSFLGNTTHPSWSPDGSMIAYGHTEKGDMNIYVMSVGGEPHQLTDNPADELGASWSPKGDKIAYFSDRGKGTEIFWIPPTGGREHRLTNTHIPFLERGFAWFIGMGISPWSSGGQELLFHRMELTGETAIWKIEVDTRNETQLTFPDPGTRDLSATWSPDGEWIAFDRNEKGIRSIWMIPAQGGEEQEVISDEYSNFKAGWTPDGQKLLFCSSRSGFIDIWEMDLDSKALRQLTNQTGLIFSYDISESGKVAYFHGGHQTDLYWGEIGSHPNTHENLTRNTRNNFNARVSRDGLDVLYHSDRTGNYEIWEYNRKNRKHLQLTSNPAIDVLADWSPDGKVLFVSDRGGKNQLWVIEEEGAPPRLISEKKIMIYGEMPVIFCTGPRWSPDGKLIGYVSPTDSAATLWLVDPETGKARATDLYGAHSFEWYLDSRRVVYTRRTPDGSGEIELRAAHLETGENIRLLKAPCGEPVVTRAGDAVGYLYAASHYNMDAYMLPLQPPISKDELPRPAGIPQQLTEGEGVWHVHNFTWVPDGKSFIYTRDKDFADIYAIENAVTTQ